MDFHNQGIITNEDENLNNTAQSLKPCDRGFLAMDESRELYHESITFVPPAIRTDL